MLDFWNDNQSLLIYLAIPITSALVGWLTNVVAIKMTFYPLNFIGIKPIGWQGIIPSKAAKMSSISVDLWTSKLINVKELFAKINPDVHESTSFISPFPHPNDGSVKSRNLQANEGDLIFFPAHLLHGSIPHKSDEDRIVFSFNLL